MALAFFDLDGTLTEYDTFVPYCLIALIHRPWRMLAIKPVLKGCIAFLRKDIGRHQLKEAFVGCFLGGATKKEIARWNKIFFRFILRWIIRKDILKKMGQHREKGDRVYIVSASPDIYVKPLATQWKLDGAICTTLELRKSRLTGKILCKNCRGEEKARRVRAAFTERELEGSFAYGDSHADLDLLELVSYGKKI
jgi:phosphatidylglycerophosphatase C